jgi:hypothetical protein
VIPLLLLTGCGPSIPAGIPQSQGTVTEADLPSLLTVASPDLPYLLLATVGTAGDEEYRDCPSIDLTVGVAIRGSGCTDSAGVKWDGSAAASSNGGIDSYTFSGFSVSGLDGAWQADGTINVTWSSADHGASVKTKVALTSLDKPSLPLWIDTTAILAEYDSITYADTYDGTIGIGDWGLADVHGSRVALAQSEGCQYAQHAAGSIRIEAKNTAQLYFLDQASSEAAADPPETFAVADTGGGDSGGDSGAVYSPGEYTPPSFGGDGSFCGTAPAAIIGEDQSDASPLFVTIERALAYPFVAPW